MNGAVHLQILDGQEHFLPLGSSHPKPVRAGGYAYVDDSSDVICMLEVRQGEKSKTTLETRECFFILQGNPNTPPNLIGAGTQRLIELVQRFCGGLVVHSGSWGNGENK